jgi:ABC-type uncharacterized transport system permease subunit
VLKLKIERGPAPGWMRVLIPVAAVVVTIIITLIFVFWAKKDPIQTYYYFLISPFTNKISLVELLVKATPLFLTGAAVTFAFTSGYYNIGAEGQMMAGATVCAFLGLQLKGISPWGGIPLMILGGFVGGVLWALVPALLKVRLKVDEVVTTLLMNSIVLFFISYLLNGPWRNPITMWPQSPDIDPGTIFPKLIPRTRLHMGFIIGLVVIAIIWFLIYRSALGLKMRAVGSNLEAARFAGVDVPRTMLISALVSGGIAGLAGGSELAGLQFHLIEQLSSGLGYSGVIVAMLGALNPVGVVLAALFLGLIDTGSQAVSLKVGVPVFFGQLVEASLLLVTLAMFLLTNYRIRRA